MPKIAPEDFDAWRDGIITQAVFRHFQQVAKEAEETWMAALKADTTPDLDRLLLVRAELKGKLAFIQEMLNLEVWDITEEESDGGSAAR